MAEQVPESDEQSLQHFLSNSPWDENAVMDHVAQDTNGLLGGYPDSALIIDESSIKKQGKKSVGVARQWSGRLGKVDNCQVGVYAALSHGNQVGIVNARLYLPEEWVGDPERCQKARVPHDAQTTKTKIDIALDMVRHARQLGLNYQWVTMNGFYGQSGDLLRALDQDGETFMADVHSDQRIYLTDPKPFIPENTSDKGRRRSRYQSEIKEISVTQWVKQQPDSAWRRHTLRNGDKGPLRVEILHQRVWLWDKKESTAHCWHLLVRREIDSPNTLKFSLSNAAAATSGFKLAARQAQRFWIERAFQDAKSHVGLARYQARNWPAWHRHMALVMMATLFMLEQRETLKQQFPLLSCYDIQVLLATQLPNRQREEGEIVRQLEQRHRKRQAAMDSAKACDKQRQRRKKRVAGNMTK